MHLLFEEFSTHIETCADSLRFSLIYPHLVGSMKVNNQGSKVSLVLVEVSSVYIRQEILDKKYLSHHPL